ncbi:MAG TPA: NHL repeat-containing protein [Verrucomicrobiae bacterium]|jgi:sugar lactone lactonase YvrE|nr:NHL repeat-containing protein [Verrucomicrobiae bacterium]
MNAKTLVQRRDRLPAIAVLLQYLALAQISLSAYCQPVYPSPYLFTTIEEKSESQPFYPKSVAVDPAGNVYFSDAKTQVICRIAPSGVVNIVAGQSGICGSTDGIGSQARFRNPRGIAIDTTGNIYVADTGNNTIRRITPDGGVTTLAGLAGTVGSDDGKGCDARFNYPVGLAVDRVGNIFVSDLYNCTIRKVTSHGAVTTFAGQAGIAGGLDGRAAAARFSFPYSIAVDGWDNIYVADAMNNAIRKVTPSGQVTTYAGKMSYTCGNADGVGKTARFCHPCGVAVDTEGNVYVADSGNETIRRISRDEAVSTVAGLAGQSGFADGAGSAARFWHPTALAMDCLGNLYVADLNNAIIRKGSGAISTDTAFTLTLPPTTYYRE